MSIRSLPAAVLPFMVVGICFAQTLKVDSLKRLITATSPFERADTSTILRLNQLAWELRADEMLQALRYAEEAESLATVIDFKRGQIQSNNYLGVIYRNLGNYAKSLHHYYAALDLAEKTGNGLEFAYATNNIGDLYKLQGDVIQAKRFAHRALVLFDSLANEHGKGYALIRLGEVSMLMNEYPEAERYLFQSLALREVLHDTIGISNVLSRLGELHLKWGNYDTAIYYNSRSTELLQMAKLDLAQVVANLLNIALAYFNSRMYHLSIERAKLSYDISGRIKFRRHQQRSAELLSQCYAAIGDYKTAYFYHIRFAEIADSLSGAITKRDMEVLRLAFESEKRKASIDFLTRKTETEQTIRYALMVVVALGLIIVLISVYSYYQKQRQNIELQRLNHLLEAEHLKALDAKKEAENANFVKSKFLGIASHDLKNPLSNVLGFSYLIEEENDISPKVRAYATQIRVGANKMLRLISDLLDTVALESGSIKLNKLSISLNQLVADAIQRNNPTAQAKHLSIHFQGCEEDVVALIDPERFDMVLDNLISNAIKYSLPSTSIYLSLCKDEFSNTLRLSIKDEGLGMTAEDMSQLFGRFARLSARPTAGESSTGLGLSIVREVVQMHGGTIRAESEGQGKGTTFIVEMPLSHQTELSS